MAVKNSRVQEVWAESTLAAPVEDVQAALLDAEAYPRFMPYVKESRKVGGPDADGSVRMYTRIGPPLVAQRDYVLRSWSTPRWGRTGRRAC